jgi:hypothetical protein
LTEATEKNNNEVTKSFFQYSSDYSPKLLLSANYEFDITSKSTIGAFFNFLSSEVSSGFKNMFGSGPAIGVSFRRNIK